MRTMNDDFWKNLTQRLTLVRKRKTLLLGLSYVLGFVGLFGLCVVSAAALHHGGSVDWPWMIVAAACVVLMLGIHAYLDYGT